MVVNPAGSSMQHTAGQFSCSNTGSFVFIHKWILHFGELSIDNGTLSCRIERVKDSPGYVDQAFMSPTGGNVACAVKRNRTPTQSSNELRNRTNYRMAMFYAAQRHRPSEENSNLVQFFVGADILCVDVFMLKIRFPSILSKVDASGQIHFTTHNLLIVTQMLEFIYSGTCEVFQTVDGCFSERKL